MAFNTAKWANRLLTHQGGKAYAPTPEWELFLLVAGSLFSGDSFYEDHQERTTRFFRLAREVTARDPEWVASLAVFARQTLGLRSGPSALVAHLFWEGPRELALATAFQVWLRGDEHLETLAYTRLQGWKLRKSLKKAVAQRLNQMSPWALLKYRARGRLFSQRDALLLCHPKAVDPPHAKVFEYLVRRNRASPEAQAFVKAVWEEKPLWERVVSQKGSTPEAWREALPHLEGLSLVRNLRNLAQQGLLEDPEVEDLLLEKLSQPERVKRWQIFPYQWLLVLQHTQDLLTPRLQQALVEAIEASLPSLPLEGETLVLVDLSGSMFYRLSSTGEATHALAATSLGALLFKATGGRLYGFHEDLVPVPLGKEAPLWDLVLYLLSNGGGGTYLGRALAKSLEDFQGRRVVIFTDEQTADDASTPLSRWRRGGPGRHAYVINMAGYEPLAFPPDGVIRVGGFSERLLHLLPALEAEDPLRWIRSFGRSRLGLQEDQALPG